jgi:hypothetical protein
MTLSPNQRSELDRLGAENVGLKLQYAGIGRGAAVIGFTTPDMDRGDVEDWLAEQSRKAATQQAQTLRWAKAAAWIGIAGIIVAIAIAAITLALTVPAVPK